jgi:DNA helicase-2/ATP-dependent DNA helicase PcrA
MGTANLLEQLNPAQQKAVMHGQGPILVLAGAGSGKTRVITFRIARLLLENLAQPSQIMAVTFTNKAAAEMKSRVDLLLGIELPGLWISTFHSACARLLRIEGAPDGIGRQFQIYDTNDQQSLIKQVIENLGLNPKIFQPRRMLAFFSQAKNQLLTPETYRPHFNDWLGDEEQKLFREYQQRLADCGAVDFDDLLLLTVRLLDENPGLARMYQQRFRYLMVDEYQDTNRAQYELVRLLAGPRGNVCAVGDEDQSIYRWRGAEVRNILDFERDFPGTRLVKLEQNYRSTGTILRAAGGVIDNNTQRKGKKLWTAAGDGEPIRLIRADSDLEEARLVTGVIREERRTVDLDQMAILYRMNYQSRVLEDALRAAGIPHKIVAGLSFYERKEIKDLVAYLKVVANPRDDLDLKRIINVPPRGVGMKTVERLEKHAAARGLSLRQALTEAANGKAGKARLPAALAELDDMLRELGQRLEGGAGPADLLEQIINGTGFAEYIRGFDIAGADRLENVEELLAKAREFEEGSGEQVDLTRFLDLVSLASDSDALDADGPQVRLMTLHTAKGLEFPLVFIVGLEEGVFPMDRGDQDPEELEEERRLFYVGITRAMKKLVISWAGRRRIYGQTRYTYEQSRFLAEIPEGCMIDPTPRQRPGQSLPRTTDLTWAPDRRARGMTARRTGASGTGSGRQAGKNAVEQARQFLANLDIKVEQPEAAPGVETLEPQPGDLVQHHKFGRGRVLQKEGQGADAKVRVHFDRVGARTLVVRYARLEVLVG